MQSLFTFIESSNAKPMSLYLFHVLHRWFIRLVGMYTKRKEFASREKIFFRGDKIRLFSEMRQNSFDRVASLESAKRPLNKSDTKWYQKVSIAKEEFISIIQSVNTCSAFLNVNRTLWNTALPFLHYPSSQRFITEMAWDSGPKWKEDKT